MNEKRHALLIGNQNYPEASGFAPLNSPHNDVMALEAVLKDPDYGRFDEVTVLLDKPYEDTLIAIQQALRSKSKNDVLLIYYSGHGKTDDNNDLYLAAPNTRSENLEITSVEARKVAKMMGDSHAEKTVLVLDCCHAGAFPAGFKSDDAVQAQADRYANSGGSYVLMACGAYELARDGEKGELSLLTQHIVDGIGGAADADKDGVVTVNELTRYLDEKMSRGSGQKINQSGQNRRGDIVLGWSGRMQVKDVVQQARIALHEWSMSNAISDQDQADVLKYFGHLRDNGVDETDPRWDLIQRVSKKSIGSGDFVSGWLRAVPPVQATLPPDPPVIPPLETPMKPEIAPERAHEPEFVDAEPAVLNSVRENEDPAPAAPTTPYDHTFIDSVLDFFSADNEWLVFLFTLALMGIATAGIPALLLAFIPDLIFAQPFGFEHMPIAIFAVSVLFFSIGWTMAYGEEEALFGAEMFLPWVLRIVLLAPLSYWLITWFSADYAWILSNIGGASTGTLPTGS